MNSPEQAKQNMFIDQ
jgi:hypothetical protein